MEGEPDSSRVRHARPNWHRRTPTLTVTLFAVGFASTVAYLWTADLDPRVTRLAQYDLWAGLLAAVVGLAAVVCLYGAIWLGGVRSLFAASARPSGLGLLRPPLIVILLVFGTLILLGSLSRGASCCDVSQEFDRSLRPLTVGSGLLVTPALAGFLAIRRLCGDGANWSLDPREQLLTLIAARSALRRLLTMLGGFLALLVVTTGMRRRALLAFNSTVAADQRVVVPPESVLLYGLTFAVTLGLFHLAAASAVDARAVAIVDALEPFPDPAAENFADRMARREQLTSAAGGPSSIASFETAVLVAAPLLSAVLGIATTS